MQGLRTLMKRLVRRFQRDTGATIAPAFAIALIPIVTAAGAAVDYSRANNIRSALQAALDTALIAGAKDGSSSWTQIASDVFNANIARKLGVAAVASPSFTRTAASSYSASVTASVTTSVLAMIRVSTLYVGARATAVASDPDNSCILTLDRGQPASHVSLTLNGAPVVNLSGCSIRSNTALDCNGHDGNVTKAIAGGLVSGCGHPQPYSEIVPDIYAPLASNITTACSGVRSNVTWTAGTLPTDAAFKTMTVNGRTEYHVCGDLTLTGSGYLTGSAPGADVLIVVENGSLNVTDGANVSAMRTGIVLTGDNTYPSSVNFPNGNGKTASLTLSPPTDTTNVWQGVALYQDPALTKNTDNKWGPGADFNADGLVYLPNSNVVTDGNTSSSNAKCSKFVMNSFTTNGKVTLDFDQSVASCAAIGLKQWGGIIVRLTS